MPLGPSAALEIGALSWELGDSAKSLQTSIGLYRSLLRREWDLEKAEFEFFVERVKGHIETFFIESAARIRPPALSSGIPELSGRRGREQEKERRGCSLFQESAAPALEAKIRRPAARRRLRPLFSRLTLDIGNDSYLVSIEKPVARAGNASDAAWGIIIDTERLREDCPPAGPARSFPVRGDVMDRQEDGTARSSCHRKIRRQAR